MALLCCSLAPASQGKQPSTSYPVVYEGGNLPLNHRKVTATLSNDQVVFTRGHRRISVPAKDITSISVARNHYVGVTWVDGTGQDGSAPKKEVLVRLSAGEYRQFISALERLTGKKAVDTTQVPTTVHYQL